MSEHPETYISWCDDGVTIVCERRECFENGFWWQRVIAGFRLSPSDLQRAIDEHVRINHG